MVQSFSLETTTYKIWAWVKSHPKAEAGHIAEALGLQQNVVSAYLNTMTNRELVTREHVRFLITNRPVYGYTVTDVPYPAQRKKPVRKAKQSVSNRNQSKTDKASETPVSSSTSSIPQGLDEMLDSMAMVLAKELAGRVRNLLPGLMAPEPSTLGASPPLLPALPAQCPPTPPQKPSASPVAAPELVAQAPFLEKQPEQIKVPLKKVCIVGLMPTQAGVLSAEFGRTFDLRFWNDEDPSKLRDIVRNCDRIFIHIRHTRHAVGEMITKAGGTPVIVKGGVTEMRHALKSYWEKLCFFASQNVSAGTNAPKNGT